MPDPHPGPDDSGALTPPVLLRAALDLSARLLTLDATARRVRRREDVEAIHDFRVAARRLNAALDLWAPLLESDTATRVRRRVRRMRRDLSDARDLEVLAAGYRDRLARSAPEARVVLEQRIAKLERRRERAARRAPRVVASARLLEVRRGLLRAVRKAAAATAPGSATDLARDHVAARRERALQALREAWERRDDASLHEARIRIKAWRYARELADEAAALTGVPVSWGAASAELGVSAAELRIVQEALGTVQDLAVMAADLARRARAAARGDRPALAATLDTILAEVAAEKQQAAEEAQRRATTLSVVAVRGRTAGA